MESEIREYLYVDQARLDSYFEQISDPQFFDKVPTVGTELSITGPKATATQARFPRPFTQHEKVLALEKYLVKVGAKVSTRTPHVGFVEQEFRLEQLWVRKVIVPEMSGQLALTEPLVLWISENTLKQKKEGIGPLILVQDYHKPDQRAVSYTGFSLLQVLLLDAFPDVETTTSYSNPKSQTPISLDFIELDSDDSRREQIVRYLSRQQRFEAKNSAWKGFSRDPFGVLNRFNSIVGDHRFVEVMYRVRVELMDSDSKPRFLFTTVGYPIVITAKGQT